MDTPRRTGWVKVVIPLLLVIYLVVGASTKLLERVTDFDPYPFFHWSLFAYPSETDRRYEVYLYEVDGERYDPPVRLQDTEAYQERLAYDHNQYHTFGVVTRLGDSVKLGEEADAAHYETFLEEHYLPDEEVRYGLYQVQYDTEARLETGEVISKEHVEDFYKDEE